MLQNVELTLKDGKILYHKFLDQPTVDNGKACNVAYKWVDENYYDD